MPERDSKDTTIEQLQERIQKLEEDNRRWMRLAGINSRTNLPGLRAVTKKVDNVPTFSRSLLG
jgi:hypothetical protein